MAIVERGKISVSQSRFLDFVRWFAATLVVIEHVRSLLIVDYGSLQSSGVFAKAFYFFTGFGHESVVVFFVISGFLVGGKVLDDWHKDRFQWNRYLCDRISRLYSVLIVALLLGTVIDTTGSTWFSATGMYDGDRAEQIAVLTTESANRVHPTVFVGNLVMLQNIYVPTYGSNGPLWSLAHEWWYYLLFPLLLCTFKDSIQFRICLLYTSPSPRD